MAESPDPGGGESWWSSFGEQYDDAAAAAAAKDSEGSVEPSALEVQLREDHAAANARLLTQLRAKSQLLELETEAKNRLAAQLAAAVANGATREHTLSKEVQQERMATEVLRDQIAALEMEVERRVSSTERSAAGEATRARVDAATEERMRQATAIEQRQRGLEKQVESMREQLLELRRTEMAERDAMKALRQAAEREALDAERNTRRRLHEDGTRQREQYQLLREAAASEQDRVMARLERLLPEGTLEEQARQRQEAEGGAPLLPSKLTAQLKKLTEQTEARVAKAEAEADEAKQQAALAELKLSAAPSAEALKRQALQAQQARAAQRRAQTELKDCIRELRAAERRAEEATKLVVAAKSDSARPARTAAAASTARRRAGSNKPPARTAAAATVAAAEPEAPAPAPAAVAVQAEAPAPAPAAEAASEAVGSSSAEALRDFYRGVARAVYGEQEQNVEYEGDEAGAAQLVGEVAMLSHRAQREVELQRAITQMQTALRARRGRPAAAQATDGTVAGAVLEVEEMVRSEGDRFAGTAFGASGPPEGAVDFVVKKLQAELEVAALTDVLPRVRDLSNALRASLDFLKSLRGVLRLPDDASMHECSDAAGRNTEVASQLTAQVRLLCEMLQVRSVEALVPAVQQLIGRTARVA